MLSFPNMASGVFGRPIGFSMFATVNLHDVGSSGFCLGFDQVEELRA